MPLTDAVISKVPPSHKPVKLTAGNGLVLEIRPTGRKFWRYRYRLNGKENMFTAGEYCRTMPGEHPAATAARIDASCLTIAEAVALTQQWRDMVASGHPPANKNRPQTKEDPSLDEETFSHIATEWMRKRSEAWCASYKRDVQSVLSADVIPFLGHISIRAITSANILALLQRIEDRGAHAVANNARQWISAVYAYAIATLRAESDPTQVLKGALTTPKTEHHKDMSHRQVGELLTKLKDYDGLRQTAIAVELLLLTFVRTNELRGAQWEEFDLARAEWRIPTSRMKARRPHVVPLSTQSIALLGELRTITGATEGYLFVNQRTGSGRMGYNTINRVLDKLGFGVNGAGFSAHGFRSTASTILNEAGFLADAIERQLAHVAEDKTRASYNHSDLMDVRRGMMQEWADMLDSFAVAYSTGETPSHTAPPEKISTAAALGLPPDNSGVEDTKPDLWMLAC